ncbi:MAG: ABC transporter permease [Planctomycetota bacterium]
MSDSTPIVRHYSAEGAPRGFLKFALPVHQFFQVVWLSRSLVWNFVRRNLLGRFRGSLGGAGWVLVFPVFQFCVYFFVFGILFAPKDKLINEGPDPFFAVYLFAGILLFGAVTEGASLSLRSILQNGSLVKKVAFPCEVLPLTNALVSMVTYAVGCVVLVIVGLSIGQLDIGWSVLAWPILIVSALVFSTGLGLLLASANVLVRDVSQFWPIFSLAWFFLSPVFWRLHLVQEKADALNIPWATNLLVLNPAYNMLMAQRQIFGIGAKLTPEHYVSLFPHSLAQNLGFSVLWAVFMFFVGYGFFMSHRHKFADLV